MTQPDESWTLTVARSERIVLSSASSKTAHGAAFELHRNGREVIALTSPRNVTFTEGLGYDAVLS